MSRKTPVGRTGTNLQVATSWIFTQQPLARGLDTGTDMKMAIDTRRFALVLGLASLALFLLGVG